KSPYPKTHNPCYEALVKAKLQSVLSDSSQPIHKLLSEEVVSDLLRQRFDYGKPWFGQLMAGPQLLAYLLQVNSWLLRYHIYLKL
ncbi:MAG: asparagine synthetase B, partial [Acutalibacter sp.]